jgi:hypothetical protein
MKKIVIPYRRKLKFLERIWERILSLFFFKQWILLVAKGAKYESSTWSNFIPLVPPADRFWADPFVWSHNGHYFIFYEEQLYSSTRGHISCLILDGHLNQIANRVVLERPYHLSYPFVFEHENQIYMMPETEQNGTVELYRCTSFPDQWVLVKTLLTDIKAVDATLLEAHGRWWLFANIREEGSSWHALHLFSAADLLSNRWVPHPLNPVVKDIRSARPAGRIFMHNGELIRPSQDCFVRYGYAINFNHVSRLTESDYGETHKWTLRPPAGGKFLATHTWNESGGLITIDALIRTFKYPARQRN